MGKKWFFISLFFCFSKAFCCDLSLEEKVGALFVLPLAPKEGEAHYEKVLSLVKECHVRYVLLKQSTKEEAKTWVARLRRDSPHPITVLIDGEWGVGMRTADGFSFPRNLTLGAILERGKREKLIEQVGYQIALEMAEIGADINLAPVVDVNSNPQNPIIHMRSFGSSIEKVKRRGNLYLKGILKGGKIACLKHFPGHGDVAIDSHLDLPLLEKDVQKLRSCEWVPFKEAIDAGAPMVMTAHLAVPSLTGSFNKPSSAFASGVSGVLRKDLGFKGAIITDALNMGAVTKSFSPEEAALQYFQAGHDLLLYGDHISDRVYDILYRQFPKAYQAIYKAAEAGEIEIDKSVQRNLALQEKTMTLPKAEYDKRAAKKLKQKLVRKAITHVGKEFGPEESYRFVTIGESPTFLERAKFLHRETSRSLVVAAFPVSDHPSISFGIEPILEYLSTQDLEKEKIILLWFGSPYAAYYFPKEISTFICYEKGSAYEKAAIKILEGKKKPEGVLPI